MGICYDCGQEIEFRHVGGILRPIHASGGCSKSGGSTKPIIYSGYSFVRDRHCFPTSCPECSAEVFFIRHNGGSVWIDPPLGPPWYKHPCMDDGGNTGHTVRRSLVPLVEKTDDRIVGVVSELEISPSKKSTIIRLEVGEKEPYLILMKHNAGFLAGQLVTFDPRSKKIEIMGEALSFTVAAVLWPQATGDEMVHCPECNLQFTAKNFKHHLLKKLQNWKSFYKRIYTLIMKPTPKTLYDKVFDSHLVHQADDGTCLLYVDRHLIHEVTSPQAFEGLRVSGRKVRRPDATLAVPDHNVPTTPERKQGIIKDETSRIQVQTLADNAAEFGITHYAMDDKRQGIVHIVGPEQGFTQPGMTIVCGDSHTSTHGAFGALAFGIGTSEVEHVLATQTLIQRRAKNMLVRVDGALPAGVTAKDIVLAIIGRIGTAGGTGYVIEYAGDAITSLSMEGRMTVCNMTIEAGARAGLIAPDEVTFEYIKGRNLAPKDAEWDKAVAYWKTLPSDAGAHYDTEIVLNAADIAPQVTWGTSPEDVLPITANVPFLKDIADEAKRSAVARSLEYMGLKEGEKLDAISIDKVFIGSCTNGRIEDLRAAAKLAEGKHIAKSIKLAMVVPGSGLVKEQAEKEGLDKIFLAAGFEWREPGCSMCLAMNADQLAPGERCASTSNRNFEGRQGRGGRTHLVSPEMAVAAAVTGHLTDVRKLGQA